MDSALYLNGVFENVLEEILKAQHSNPDLVCYLQPHAAKRIAQIAANPPTPGTPVTLYISVSTRLSDVRYRAKIVGWENKPDIEESRIAGLNLHISRYQPGEDDIYMSKGDTPCTNLISVIDMECLTTPVSVSSLIKTSDMTPLKPRTMGGGWAYVYPLPDWVGNIPQGSTEEELNTRLESDVKKSLSLRESEREQRLETAFKMPEAIQVISRRFRRNPDVVASVLNRANGKCEHCGNEAPFIRSVDGTPYLEVHHRIMLADGGEDTTDNAMAVCPNCHRELHFGTTLLDLAGIENVKGEEGRHA